MMRKMFKEKWKTLLLVALVGALSLSMAGCSADSNDSTAAATGSDDVVVAEPADSVLIDADTLNDWITEGRLNNDGADEIVILDVTSAANYAAGHIEGAQNWNTATSLYQTRTEGPADFTRMVLTGANMNTLLATFGIEADTTIVITAAGNESVTSPARGYFTLRYWGFPKERIKVLNGYDGAWTAAGYDLVTDATTGITASTYTVADLGTYTGNERMSLTEMIDAVKYADGVPVDMRGDNRSVSTNAFAGRIKGDKFVTYTSLYKQYTAETDPLTGATLAAKDLSFKSAAELEALYNAAGVDNSRTIYTYCTSGFIASTGFLALDGVLGWDVAVYDGSWSQWGNLSNYADVPVGKGPLADDSVWRTDTADTMDLIIYNTATSVGLTNLVPDVLFEDGNQIEDADYDAVYAD